MKNGRVQATICMNLGLTDITEFANNILDFQNTILTRNDGYIMADSTANLKMNIPWPELH